MATRAPKTIDPNAPKSNLLHTQIKAVSAAKASAAASRGTGNLGSSPIKAKASGKPDTFAYTAPKTKQTEGDAARMMHEMAAMSARLKELEGQATPAPASNVYQVDKCARSMDIPDRINYLGNSISALDTAISTLIKRLAPVLNQDQDTDGDTDSLTLNPGTEHSSTKMGGELARLQQRVESLTGLTRATLEILELE